ncbi:MAG TPA: FMN-binding protein, partial [Anaerohalosphaeraceae bacterium]|nr:FMN-binding protein [Anaerohalosphaeraceae bacterium]
TVVQVFPDIRFQHDEQIHRIFTQQFEKDPRSGAFRFLKDGRLAGYAVPFSGQGFWDKIEGVIGVAADRRTITGIAFYRQNETPGLGARIEEEEFRSQFAGKRLAESPILLEIVPSAQPLGPNSVHAVTGATQTSDRLQILLNANLHTWLEAVSNEGEAQ